MNILNTKKRHLRSLFEKKMKEIERKFIVRRLPDLSRIKPVKYERFFLGIDDKSETRVQSKDGRYEIEKKVKNSLLTSEKEKEEMTKEEFENLKKNTSKAIIRDSYLLGKPSTTIKIYHGDFEGLIRLEVEFESENEAKKYTPPLFAGKEITGTGLGNDSSLIRLNRQEFRNLLKKYS